MDRIAHSSHVDIGGGVLVSLVFVITMKEERFIGSVGMRKNIKNHRDDKNSSLN